MSKLVCRIVKKVKCNVNDNILHACVEKVLTNENRTGYATVVFVSQSEITDLNKKFRNKNAPTDVLSFPNQDSEPKQDQKTPPYLGEIVICPDQIHTTQQQEFVWEVCHLVVHGMFHLLGVHHEHSENAYQTIHQKEITLINDILQSK